MMFDCDSDFDVDEDLLESIASNEFPGLCKSNDTDHHQIQPTEIDKECLHNVIYSEPLSENHLNKSVDRSNCSRNNVIENSLPQMRDAFAGITSVERRFPGPAGLLPERKNITSAFTTDSNETRINALENIHNSSIGHHTMLAWQSLLQSLAWEKFLMDFEAHPESKDVLNCINIKNIKEKASARLLVHKKVPFLAAILNEVDLSSSDPYVTLCDQTGLINGTLHRDTWKQFGDDLIPGCVIVLRNTGVLSLGINPLKNQHYLNITSRNLATLYTSQEDAVTATNIMPFCSDEITKSLQDWLSNIEPDLSPLRLSNQNPQRLFSSPLVHQKNTLNEVPTVRNLLVSPQTNSRSPLPSTPIRNLSRENSKSNQTHYGNATTTLRSPAFSPIQQTNYSAHTVKCNSNKNKPCNSTTSKASNHVNQNSVNFGITPKKSLINLHNNNVNNSYNISKTNLPKPNDKSPNIFSLDISSKNGSNSKCKSSADQSFNFQIPSVRHCQNENKSPISFIPKRARIEIQEQSSTKQFSSNVLNINGHQTSAPINKSKICDSITYSNSSSCNKDIDEQSEVETILSSIDNESFFEEEF